MGAFRKVFLSILLLMGASFVMASSVGTDGQGPSLHQGHGVLPKAEPVRVLSPVVTSGSMPETASVTMPGALGLFLTTIIGAGVIARKKRRGQRHEALGS